jgi:hypothetical protein
MPDTKKEIALGHRLVFFFGGLTARMGYKQQKNVAVFADIAFFIFVSLSFSLGWYFERFSITVYGVAACGLLCLIVMVPNWSSAWTSAREGKIVTGLDELSFLPNKTVRQYYKELRKDELRVEPARRAPMRFPEE